MAYRTAFFAPLRGRSCWVYHGKSFGRCNFAQVGIGTDKAVDSMTTLHINGNGELNRIQRAYAASQPVFLNQFFGRLEVPN